jgi:hypothetical protein
VPASVRNRLFLKDLSSESSVSDCLWGKVWLHEVAFPSEETLSGRSGGPPKVRAESSELLAASCKLRAASCELRAASCELRAASCELRAASSELPAASWELRAASCEVRAPSCCSGEASLQCCKYPGSSLKRANLGEASLEEARSLPHESSATLEEANLENELFQYFSESSVSKPGRGKPRGGKLGGSEPRGGKLRSSMPSGGKH